MLRAAKCVYSGVVLPGDRVAWSQHLLICTRDKAAHMLKGQHFYCEESPTSKQFKLQKNKLVWRMSSPLKGGRDNGMLTEAIVFGGWSEGGFFLCSLNSFHNKHIHICVY